MHAPLPSGSTPMTAWSIDQALKTYSIPHWAEGYFDIDARGRIVVHPRGAQAPGVANRKSVV